REPLVFRRFRNRARCAGFDGLLGSLRRPIGTVDPESGLTARAARRAVAGGVDEHWSRVGQLLPLQQYVGDVFVLLGLAAAGSGLTVFRRPDLLVAIAIGGHHLPYIHELLKRRVR